MVVFLPLMEKLDALGYDYRILILSDHKTLTSTRGHDGTPVPYLLYDSRRDNHTGLTYCEECGELRETVDPGTKLMGMLFAE